MKSITLRLVAIAVSFALFMNVASAGVYSLVAGAVGAATAALQGEPPEFTESPGTPYVGDNPLVDPIGRGDFWTSDMLGFLGEMQLLEATDEPMPPAQATGGGGIGGNGFSFGGEAGGGEPVQGDPASGGTWPWEAYGPGGGSSSAPGLVSTQTGNRLTIVPLLHWPSRGQTSVELTLYHNSRNEGLFSFGYSWRTNYDVTIYQSPSPIPGTNLLSAIVQWPDGRYIPYRQQSQYSSVYVSPYGLYDKLERVYGGWQLTRKRSHEVWLFNANGYLTALRDRNGNQVSVTRTGANYRISTVTDPSGRALTFAAGSNGRISSCTDHTGRVWNFGYSSGTNLSGITYPLLNGNSHTRQFGYDGYHNITSETDLRGKIWRCSYDSGQRLSWFKDPFLNQTSYAYFPSYTRWTLPLGQQYKHNYSSGMLASAVDPAGFSVAFRYDAYRNTIRVTDQSATDFYFTFDTRGNRLTQITGGNTTYYTYDTGDNVKTVSAPSATEYKTTLNYDSHNNLTSVVDYLGRNQAVISYDSYGQALTLVDAVSRTSSFGYNANGDLTSTTESGGTWTSTYDSLGRPISATDPASGTTSFAYDSWDRLLSVTNADQTVATLDADLEGNMTAVHDELNRVSSFTFDDAGRVTDAYNARGDHEIYFYDANGRLFKVRNGRGYDTTLAFTARSEVWKQVLADGATEYFSYNGRGQIGRYTNPLGQQINYYNTIYGPTSIAYPAGAGLSMEYDFAGRLTYLYDGVAALSWSYDGMGDLASFGSGHTGNLITYAYDAAGRQTQMTNWYGSTSDVTTYAHDDANRRITVTNPFSESSVLTFDTSQRLSRMDHASGAYEVYAYDNRSRPTSFQLKNAGGTVLSSQSYTYNAVSNVQTHIQDGVTTTYGYDAIDQLVSESRPGYSASYTYDANGNRASRTVNGLVETYTSDAADKLTSVTWNGGYKNFAYDLCGRVTGVTTPAGTATIGYDIEDRVTSITYPNGGGTGTYGYNAFGARISRTDRYGQPFTYRRDGAGVTDPLLQDGLATYTPGVSEKRSGVTTYSHSGLKNGSVQSTAGQTVSASRIYDAFGNLSSTSGTWSGPFGYGGPYGYQEDSDSGLKLLGHRFYDPSIGRFLTRDKAYDGRNWYGYCDNSPLVSTDPSGLKVVFGFDFTLEGIGNGLMTGLASVGSWASCGLWDGGRWKNEIGFDTSTMILEYGTAPAQFVGTGGTGSFLSVGARALGLANRAGKLAKAASVVQKAGGRLGGAAHRAAVREGAEQLSKENPLWALIAGGGKHPERAVDAMGKKRFPDMTFEDERGRLIYVNVGRRTKSGLPISRERKALKDLGLVGRVIFRGF